MHRHKKRFEQAPRRLITAYFCENNGDNIARFAEYGLVPEYDDKTGWSLRVEQEHEGVPEGTVLDQNQLFAVVFGDLCVKTKRPDILQGLKQGLVCSVKEKAPIQGAKLAAGSLAMILCPPGFAAVMATYSLARTINGSRNYLKMRRQYDQADAMTQSYMKDQIFSAETFSRVTAPAILDALTMGLLDSSVTDDLHDVVSAMKEEIDMGVADDVTDSLNGTRPRAALKKMPVMTLATKGRAPQARAV